MGIQEEAIQRLMQVSTAEQGNYLNAPALWPPPGVVPHFDHPPNKNYLGVITNIICLVATTSLLSLRIYTKVYCHKKVHVEDYIGTLAWVIFICSIGCQAWLIRVRGIFVHQWNFHVKDLSMFFYILHVELNLISVSITLIKAAILLDWIRIFVPRHTRNFFFWTSVVVLAVQTTFHVIMIVVDNLSCIPHRKIWDQSVTWGACIDFYDLFYPGAAINIFTDIVILVLPQKEIWSLKMANKNKVSASLVFLTGIFTCICAGLRSHSSDRYYRSEDRSYAAVSMHLWALAETSCLFLVFCVPTIPRAFVQMGCWRRMGVGAAAAAAAAAAHPLSGSRNTARNLCSSQSSTQLRTIERCPSSLCAHAQAHARAHQSDELDRSTPVHSSQFLRSPSVRSTRGPITEISAGSQGEAGAQEDVPFGILRTTQVTTEISMREDVEGEEDVVVVVGKGHERHDWSSVHM